MYLQFTHHEMKSNPKSPSLPRNMIIRMQVAGRGSRAEMWDDGSRKLQMKTMQETLRYGDRRHESIVTGSKVWVNWEAKLHKF